MILQLFVNMSQAVKQFKHQQAQLEKDNKLLIDTNKTLFETSKRLLSINEKLRTTLTAHDKSLGKYFEKNEC